MNAFQSKGSTVVDHSMARSKANDQAKKLSEICGTTLSQTAFIFSYCTITMPS
jgi:hypothetical protein